MLILSYIKFTIMILGLVGMLFYLIPGLKHNDNLKKTRAGLLFVFSCVAVLLVTLIEFVIHYKG